MDIPHKEYKASDVLKAANLTYRQLNNWDSKNAVNPSRNSERGWRRFTFEELICLSIASRLKDVGASLEFIGQLYSWLMGSNQIVDILDMVTEGTSCFLVTNLDDDMHVCDPNKSVISFGVYQYEAKPIIYFPLNTFINEIIERLLDKAEYFPISYDVYDYLEQFVEFHSGLEEREKKILEILRQKQFKKVVIDTEEGSLVMGIAEDCADEQIAEIENIVDMHEYRRILIMQEDGSVHRAARQSWQVGPPGHERTGG